GEDGGEEGGALVEGLPGLIRIVVVGVNAQRHASLRCGSVVGDVTHHYRRHAKRKHLSVLKSCADHCAMPNRSCARTIVRATAAAGSAPSLDGNTKGESPASVSASLIMRTARSDNATQCGWPFFVRLPGKCHSRLVRSSSASCAPVTSPTRWAVIRHS